MQDDTGMLKSDMAAMSAIAIATSMAAVSNHIPVPQSNETPYSRSLKRPTKYRASAPDGRHPCKKDPTREEIVARRKRDKQNRRRGRNERR